MQMNSVVPYEGPEKYFFVSFCRADAERVFSLLDRMARDGCRFWYNAPAAGAPPEKVAERLNGAEACVAVIGDGLLADEACRREISYALTKRKFYVSLYIAHPDLPPAIGAQLSTYRSFTALAPADEPECLRQLYAVPKIAACKASSETSAILPPQFSPQRPVSRNLRQIQTDGVQITRLEDPAPEALESAPVVQLPQPMHTEPPFAAPPEPVDGKDSPFAPPAPERSAPPAGPQAALPEDAEDDVPAAKPQHTPRTAAWMRSDYQLVRLADGSVTDILMGVSLLGRAADRVDYAIPDNPSIGRVHAKFVANPAGCTVTDNNSLNKTGINGTELEPNRAYPLEDGDIVCFSDEQFLFRRAKR